MAGGSRCDSQPSDEFVRFRTDRRPSGSFPDTGIEELALLVTISRSVLGIWMRHRNSHRTPSHARFSVLTVWTEQQLEAHHVQ